MFAVRGIAVSLSIFVLLYCALSIAVIVVWRKVWLWSQRYSAGDCADLLLILRLAPFTIAAGLTLALVVPSFLLLEPHTASEPMSGVPVVLGFCGIAVVMVGIWNAVLALRKASRTVARWSQASCAITSSSAAIHAVCSLRSSASAPPLTAAGILRSTVWLSPAAELALSTNELEGALRHEVVHLRRRDNLRKLILRLVAFPGIAKLERAWREATEMAADDAAVSSASQALDLASALIKLSRLAPPELPAELTTALVHGPAESVNGRVERLLTWADRRQVAAERYSPVSALYVAAAIALTVAVSYSQLLVLVHAASEWLVR